ncbi:Protein kinase superfamily protein [Forsythia ovata]|uniref:Protein kinase superfamily protein n=1 Tax=Forsythia ovata TaxID=205694 RepID=A0ABD1WR83_9LAMI
MSKNYNWERLVETVLQREQFWQLALAHSRESSISSVSSSSNFGLESLHLEASSIKVHDTDGERLLPSDYREIIPTCTPARSIARLSRFSAAVSGEILLTSNLKIYTFADLKNVTKNLKPDMVLGVGGFGAVFKGRVDSKTLSPSKVGAGMIVAVKKRNPESTQGFEEWQNEFLLQNNRDLRSGIEPLSWDIRLKISIGAARGLAFLHTLDKPYRNFMPSNIKPSNILLDGSYNAKLSDFGFPKLVPSEGNSHATTRVMGTYGYAALEYVATGHLYLKSSVYGFGVVLLEMLTGLPVLDYNRPIGQQNLVVYAKPFLSQKRKLMSIMDARMDGQYFSKAALQASQLTLRCLESEPIKRPSMKEVVAALEQIAVVVMQLEACKEEKYRIEFAKGGKISKSVVCGFGVVSLEMLTGLCALDTNRPSGQQNLVDYAKPFLSRKRKLTSIMNARMEVQYSSNAALKTAQLSLRALN